MMSIIKRVICIFMLLDTIIIQECIPVTILGPRKAVIKYNQKYVKVHKQLYFKRRIIHNNMTIPFFIEKSK